MTRLAVVLDSAGITRDELRAIVRVRQEELIAETQRQLDEDLLRLGREFKVDRQERDAPRAAAERSAKPRPSASGAPVAPKLPQLIETAGCAAYACTNAASITVVRAFNGRELRVRYCRPHADEVLSEKLAAAGGLNGRST